jgi:2-dehydropantoate 2-reductase
MENKVKIAIVGLGGVGGFYGGLLANYYEKSQEVIINFLVRGTNLEKIKDRGLEVWNKDEKIIGKPKIATDNPEEIGVVDYIMLCTKGYDLARVIEQIQPMLGPNTVVIPLLNGVMAYESLKEKLSKIEVWQGCTYMVSRLKEAGVIDNPSGRQKIFIGVNGELSDRMKEFERLLKDAKINIIATNDISKEVWEKYILVSASAVATTYFNKSIGAIMKDHLAEVQKLITEACAIAIAKQIKLPVEVESLVEERLKAIPFESTTSMHSDFINQSLHTELEVMAGYMVEQGEKMQIPTPMYSKMYNSLKKYQEEIYP